MVTVMIPRFMILLTLPDFNYLDTGGSSWGSSWFVLDHMFKIVVFCVRLLG